ncbi:MAG: cytochrome c maturation protein CcmE [Rhodospirillaceae bacterium]|jgi:cytochrome c-type biogenesis protein CcmE|nr:cytochrome c maturation protein CcmE [Rhodospirillaceae bacterium]|tara:strand:- start:1246 stop:1710 length:465 start_codon:yes stop_codon:yes gene_type:complete
MKRKHKRLTFVVVALGLLGAAAGLVLSAFEENIVFFYSPTDIAEKNIADGRRIRLGGLVEEGSVKKAGGAVVNFRVTDLTTAIPVTYKGLLPDLFSEGQGVVAEGTLQGGVFRADEVLAKHDETYMPPEVAEALKKSGQWKGKMETKKKSERLY